MLDKIETTSSVDACADQLRTAIFRGRYKAGARLPTERELAQTFGVARPTARSALMQLGAERLVAKKQGSGYLVRDFLREAGPLLLPKWLPLLSRKKQSVIVRDLLRLRRFLALALFERLGEIDDPDLSKVHQAIDQMDGAKNIAAADLAIVTALLDVADSPVLHLCYNPIKYVLLSSKALRAAIYRDPAANIRHWQLVLAAVQSGHSEAIYDAMKSFDDETLSHFARHR